ncbi:hypothetical protein QQF64_030660 [Cirrhinus molitorella]|uniref:Uncharacterized protein n=1 Tax=Cirrhinus molitorella TaxID=172907 RepID=A0ABR3N430_9TELE
MERIGKEREDEGSVKEGGRILLFPHYSPTPPLLCSPDYAVAEGVEHISIACMVQALQTQTFDEQSSSLLILSKNTQHGV